MKKIHRTYQFSLMPSKEQEILLSKHFGCVRWVYNHFLNERKEQYRQNRKSDNYHRQAGTLTMIKKEEETIWLKEVNSQSLQTALRYLDTAFVNFFRGNAKFPRFKSKRKKNSFTVPQFVKAEGDRLIFPKFNEGIKINLHRKIEGAIRHCTVSKTPTGKYFVSILCEVEHTPKGATGKSCGVDLGIKDFAVTSDGYRFKNNRHTKHYARALKSAGKHLARKKKGSANRNKQRLKLARVHEKISNRRLDLLHKVSTQIINGYDIICVEDLNVKGMMANRKLAKHIADVSWGKFVEMLQYKAAWNDRQLVKINRWYPSSKTCHECEWIHQNMNLSEREWICANGHTLDRDVNASRNILKEGLKIISSGTGDYTCGDLAKTSSKKRGSVKQEALRSLAGG